jgi:hypothetical protein
MPKSTYNKAKQHQSSLSFAAFLTKKKRIKSMFIPSLFLEKRLDKKLASSKALATSQGLVLPPQRNAQCFGPKGFVRRAATPHGLAELARLTRNGIVHSWVVLR